MSDARFVLGIDTAGRQGSIALAVNGVTRNGEPLAPREHSSGLSLAGERLLRLWNLEWRDLVGIAVASGPGSFTGLRIGLAWAKGMCLGSRARLLLVSSHEAHAHRHRREARYIATVLPGERHEVQAMLWSGGDEIGTVWGPESGDENDTALRLRDEASRHIILDSVESPANDTDRRPRLVLACPDMNSFLLHRYQEIFRDFGYDAAPPVASAVAERGDAMLLRGESADLASAAPAYGRSPNARKPGS